MNRIKQLTNCPSKIGAKNEAAFSDGLTEFLLSAALLPVGKEGFEALVSERMMDELLDHLERDRRDVSSG